MGAIIIIRLFQCWCMKILFGLEQQMELIEVKLLIQLYTQAGTNLLFSKIVLSGYIILTPIKGYLEILLLALLGRSGMENLLYGQ